jgi:type I restriction enzyme M protein
MTSSIARMNCFLHGIEDFQIVRGDTLAEPKLVQGDRLMRFDVVPANPPYSIKQWDRDAFSADPRGRNVYDTPPQGRADYAFWQHTSQGERLVQRELRRTLLKYKLHTDQELFDKAYGYIRQYY